MSVIERISVDLFPMICGDALPYVNGLFSKKDAFRYGSRTFVLIQVLHSNNYRSSWLVPMNEIGFGGREIDMPYQWNKATFISSGASIDDAIRYYGDS